MCDFSRARTGAALTLETSRQAGKKWRRMKMGDKEFRL
jgi:hypothetical protein